jgi:anti-sigma factor RsiW
MRKTTDEILMRRYLLGDLPQEERARLEDRYLTDAEVFEEFVAIENDLIDAYVRGELTEGERRKFEAEYFKSPQRRERVEFARALRQVSALAMQAVPTQTASLWEKVRAAFSVPHRMPQWALAAAALVMVASGSWLMVQNQRLRVALQQSLAQQAELRREEDTLRQHIAELEGNAKDQTHQNQQGSEVAKLETPMGLEVTFGLTPGVARGSGGPQNTLILPTTASRLRLQLMLDRDEYKTYEGVLLTAERKEVLRGKALQSHSTGGSAAVTWRLPADSIHSGEYIVQLTGQPATGGPEDVESYSFRVVRR